VRLDALLELVVDGSELKIVFEVLERRLDFRELDIELPQFLGVVATQVGAPKQPLC
jgi:hypothetical protein